MRVKKNDTVLVLTGKDAGKSGKVLNVQPGTDKKNTRVVVDGINIQKKHQKARNAQTQSAIVDQAGAIDISNVMVICPTCNKATRVGFKKEGDKKVRVCKKCGAILDATKEAKEVKKTAKRTTKKKVEKTEE